MDGFGQIMKNMLTLGPGTNSAATTGSPAWMNKQTAEQKQQEEDRLAQQRQDEELEHAHSIGGKIMIGGMIQDQMLGADGKTPVIIHRPPNEDEYVATYPGRRGTQPAKVVIPSGQAQHDFQIRNKAEEAGQVAEKTVGGTLKAQTAGIVPMSLEQGKAEIQKRQQAIQAQGVPMPPDVAATVGAPPGMMILQNELPNWQLEAAKIREANRVKTSGDERVTDLTPGAAAPAGGAPPTDTGGSAQPAAQGAATAPAAAPSTPPAASTPAGPVGRVVAGAPRMSDLEFQRAVDAAIPDISSPLHARAMTLGNTWRNRGNDSKALEEIQRAGEEAGAPAKAAAVEKATGPIKLDQAVETEKRLTPFRVAQQVATARALRQGDNPAMAKVAPLMQPKVMADVMKLDQDQYKANKAVDDMGALLDLAEKGNKAAGANVPLVGVGALNAVNGIKRINSAEISQYGGAGSLLDQIQGKLGKWTSGKPIPQDVLEDIRTLHQTLGTQSYQNYLQNLEGLKARTGYDGPPVAPAPNIRKGPESAPSYKAGDARVVNGMTYVRDDKGIWKPK